MPDTTGAQPITPELYADCYARCRTAIRSLGGHEDDLVLVAAIAPWNDDTRYEGNEWGDWALYFRDVLELLGPEGCDGFALHAYTHHADPRLIRSSATLDGPFAGRHAEFRVYRDFLQAVPQVMRHLPAFITEADPTEPWPRPEGSRRRTEGPGGLPGGNPSGGGWIRAVYDEIDEWNRAQRVSAGSQPVCCVALYRWEGEDGPNLRGNPGAHLDFKLALRGDHLWNDAMAYAANQVWRRNDRAVTLTTAPLLPAPLGAGGPQGSPLRGGGEPDGEVCAYSLVEAVDGQAALARGMVWRQVREVGVGDGLRQGWAPEYGPGEGKMLARFAPAGCTRSSAGSLRGYGAAPIRPGDVVRTLDWVRMRLTPGYVSKAVEDVVQDVLPDSLLGVTGGPKSVDGLTWWLLRLFDEAGSGNIGWMAEASPSGQRLLQRQDAPPKEPRPAFEPGELAETLAYVRLRKTPGYVDKPPDDMITDLWQGTAVAILSGPRLADGLAWWEVRVQTEDGETVCGWMAQNSPEGLPLLGKRSTTEPPIFEVGDLAAVGAAPVRVRRTAGLIGKPDNDVLGEYRARAVLAIQGGPKERDGIQWLRTGGIGASGDALLGWSAQTTPGGVLLIGKPLPLPGTDIPNGTTGAFLTGPFAGVYGIGQLWGENPAFYRRYSYDGVSLIGHNGIDFLTPFGTPLRAADAGTVLSVGFEPGGFGNYVLLAHTWGESIYAHLERVTVEIGQPLLAGERIGLSGNSGGSTGPHLHFAIRIRPYERSDGWGGYSDPLLYLDPDIVVMPDYVLHEDLRMKQSEDEPGSSRLAPSPMIDDSPGLVRP